MAVAAVCSAASSCQPHEKGMNRENHQALKSALGLSRLIEAMINCIVKAGYTNIATPQATTEAGFPSSAMLYRFEDRRAQIETPICNSNARVMS